MANANYDAIVRTREIILRRFPGRANVPDCETCDYLKHCKRLQITSPDAEVPCEVTLDESGIIQVMPFREDLRQGEWIDIEYHKKLRDANHDYNAMWNDKRGA